MPWYSYIAIGAGIGLWVVIHGWNPADHPPEKVTAKSLLGVVLGALGGALGAWASGGFAASDPMPARAMVAALATGYVLSGIGTFLGSGRSAGAR
jgi:hypothetical protein